MFTKHLPCMAVMQIGGSVEDNDKFKILRVLLPVKDFSLVVHEMILSLISDNIQRGFA